MGDILLDSNDGNQANKWIRNSTSKKRKKKGGGETSHVTVTMPSLRPQACTYKLILLTKTFVMTLMFFSSHSIHAPLLSKTTLILSLLIYSCQ